MFWDNVLFASKMGNQLYENDIFNWTIPDSFDPGHPPFLGFLLAIAWKILGKSLWVSHLVMLPFVIGTLVQIHKLVFHFTKNTIASFLGVLLISADPTLSATLVLVNPETIILFFFFLTINGILYDQKKWKFIGLLFLSIISFRSMMLFAGIFLFDFCNHKFLKRQRLKSFLNKNFILIYILSSIPGIIFVSWRLSTKGWLQTHEGSPWSSLWNFPSLNEFLKNVLVLIWRYLDYGRIFILLFLIVSLISILRKRTLSSSIKQLLLLSFTSVFFVILASLLSTNAFGHRYFTVSYITLTLSAFLILKEIMKSKKIIYIVLLVGLFSGNLWVYPEKISQGWDATLAHVPYHSLRNKAITFLDNENIKLDEVGTFFPNYNTQDQIDLNGDDRALSQLDQNNNYIFYSNVYNLSTEDYNYIQDNYLEIKRFESFQVYISILKRTSNE